VGLCFLLLPVLGFLQLRWIDELADAETARLSNFVSTGVARVRLDLEEGLAAVEGRFRSLQGNSGAELEADLLQRIRAGNIEGADGRWVRAVLWIDPEQPESPRRFDADAGRFEPTGWTDELRPWRDLVNLVGTSTEPVHGALPADPPGLLLPQFESGAGTRTDRVVTGRPWMLLLLLDERALRETFLPSLVTTHLGQAFGPPVDVVVTHGGQTWFRSPRSVDAAEEPAEESPADAVARVAGGRLEITESGGVRLTRRGLGRNEVEIQTSDLDTNSPRELAGTSRRSAVSVTLDVPDWEIRARHSAGSIAVAVAAARRRNLALGLGTLGVLTVATVLLVLAARRARRLARRQLEFVAGITHELRTPLTVIRSASENLAEGVVDDLEHARRYGRILLEEGRRLSDLVEQALTLAGARGSSSPPALEAVDLEALVAGVIERSDDDARAARASIEFERSGDLPPISAHRLSLERAVSNLLANALKYAGEGRMGVRLRRARPDAVEVVVWDSGPGIPESEQARLFEPFVRGRAARESQTPGSGLGLSVVRHIAETLGGTVTLESRAGAGAAFTLRLPVTPT